MVRLVHGESIGRVSRAPCGVNDAINSNALGGLFEFKDLRTVGQRIKAAKHQQQEDCGEAHKLPVLAWEMRIRCRFGGAREHRFDANGTIRWTGFDALSYRLCASGKCRACRIGIFSKAPNSKPLRFLILGFAFHRFLVRAGLDCIEKASDRG